jgi:hypothetical protein
LNVPKWLARVPRHRTSDADTNLSLPVGLSERGLLARRPDTAIALVSHAEITPCRNCLLGDSDPHTLRALLLGSGLSPLVSAPL